MLFANLPCPRDFFEKNGGILEGIPTTQKNAMFFPPKEGIFTKGQWLNVFYFFFLDKLG